MEKEKSFFEKFDDASWEFTYGNLDIMDYNVLQVGLTAVFYIDEGWRPEKREAMANAIERYIEEFGDKLKWGFIDNVNKPESFIMSDIHSRMQRLANLEDDAAEESWGSEYYKDYVSDYQVDLYSPAGWFEHVHRNVSYIRFFLQISEIKEEGRERFEKLVLEFCQLLQPMHGLAGLGTQQLYEDNPYQHLECEIAQNFNGIDITTHLSHEGLRDGIRSINWYTILSDEWLEKAGGYTHLEQQFLNTGIQLLPYNGGVVIKAGEWPELGWVEKDPTPELYVRVNQALRCIRTPSFGSFHLGSNSGEIRMHTALTAKWQARFDVEPPSVPRLHVPATPVRIRAKTGETCPHSGRWATIEGGQQCIQMEAGKIMPRAIKYQSDIYAPEIRLDAVWTLLERDDGESVFSDVDVN